VARELELLHASYLNIAQHRGTLEAGRKSEYRGLTGLEYIGRRLGHRLVADRLSVSVRVGTTLTGRRIPPERLWRESFRGALREM
jgi:hypothetical protein